MLEPKVLPKGKKTTACVLHSHWIFVFKWQNQNWKTSCFVAAVKKQVNKKWETTTFIFSCDLKDETMHIEVYYGFPRERPIDVLR